MSDQLPPDPGESPQKGGWRRPLSYLLLILGAAGIIFNNQLSLNTGISVTVLQIATLGLFIAGAILFYSVRETADRVSSYREVFTSPNKPADPSASEFPGPSEPSLNAPDGEPPSKDPQPGDLDDK
jgi:hypothetical protein